jgi:hypothetical protein
MVGMLIEGATDYSTSTTPLATPKPCVDPRPPGNRRPVSRVGLAG